MRFVPGLLLFAMTTSSLAGSKTSSDSSNTGRLGQVTSGIDKASHSSSSSSSSTTTRDRSSSDDTVYVTTCCDSYAEPSEHRPLQLPPIHTDFHGFAGAQRVFESTGSLQLDLAAEFNHRVRLDAAVSHYYEDEMDGSRITMTVPTATFGLRLGSHRTSDLWLEAGAAYLRTVDPAGSSALWGSVMDLRFEHRLTPDTAVMATGGAMLFDGVQAATARVGIRSHHIEAAFRVLDFSVGPALYGPEIGISF